MYEFVVSLLISLPSLFLPSIIHKGKNTPGIDKVIWKTNEQKFQAIMVLRNLSKYKAKPVRRVYIPKANGSPRPLGIPTLLDRAVQTLWYFALIPIAEETADPQSYGFRPYRGVHDCATYLKLVCGSYTATRRFVLNADIKSFFDSVSHDWLLKNIPMDKRILKEFLKAGFLSDNAFEVTPEGFPQGAVISPTIANMTLDGLKRAIGEEFLMTRYADDFIVLGKTKRDLKLKALPTIQNFLGKRGLELNLAKTKIATPVAIDNAIIITSKNFCLRSRWRYKVSCLCFRILPSIAISSSHAFEPIVYCIHCFSSALCASAFFLAA